MTLFMTNEKSTQLQPWPNMYRKGDVYISVCLCVFMYVYVRCIFDPSFLKTIYCQNKIGWLTSMKKKST